MATWQMGSKSIPGGGSLTHTPAVMHYSLWSKSSSGELGFPLHRKHTEVILRLQESQRAQNTIGASPLLGQAVLKTPHVCLVEPKKANSLETPQTSMVTLLQEYVRGRPGDRED